MSWTDYIPGASTVYGWMQDLGAGAGGAKNYFYDDPANKQKNALNTMSDQARQLGADSRNFQLQGLNQAESYFLPAQQRLQELYGGADSMRK